MSNPNEGIPIEKNVQYNDPSGNVINVNVNKQKMIENQIANQISEKKMDEEQNNDIIDLTKEDKKDDKKMEEETDYKEILLEMEKAEKFQENLDQSNMAVPWIKPELKNEVWKLKKGTIDKQFYTQPVIGRAINIRFSYQNMNREGFKEVGKNEKKREMIEIKKENMILSINKMGEFKESGKISSKNTVKTEIEILLEYKIRYNNEIVYYILTIDKWNVELKRIIEKPYLYPQLAELDDRVSNSYFLPEEYQVKPKRRVFIPMKEYDKNDPEAVKKERLERKKGMEMMNLDFEKRTKEWEKKRSWLLVDIGNRRMKARKEEKERFNKKPKKNISEIREEMKKIGEKKNVIEKEGKEIDMEIIELRKELNSLSAEERLLRRNEINKRINELFNKKRKNIRGVDDEYEQSRYEISEMIGDAKEIEIMPKYEMIKVDTKKYQKGDVGYELFEGKMVMPKEKYEMLKKEREEKEKILEIQEEMAKEWTVEDQNIYNNIKDKLSKSGDLVEIVQKYNDLTDCSEEEAIKVIEIMRLYENDIEYSNDVNENVRRILEKMVEYTNLQKELEIKYGKHEKAKKYLKRYNELKEILMSRNPITENEDEEYSVMEEEGEEQKEGEKKNRAVKWMEQKTGLFLPEFGNYEPTDDYYSTSSELEIKPAGTEVKTRQKEKRVLESEAIIIDINITKGGKGSYINLYVTKDKGYITFVLDKDITEEFKEILRNGTVKQIIYKTYNKKDN